MWQQIMMRSSLLVRASDCQCTSCNGPGFDPSIRRHSGIWGAADEAVLNIVRKKIEIMKPQKLAINICWFFFVSPANGLAAVQSFWKFFKWVNGVGSGRREMLGIGLWPWWFCFIFQFGHHLGMYIFHFPPTPAKLIGDDPKISNLAFVSIL